MIAIINQKKYNTDTAQEVASVWNNLPTSDFNFMNETLYRTKHGNWFLHGMGGAASKYAESNGNGYIRGEKIIPLTEAEAYDFLEKNGETSVIMDFFSDWVTEA